MIGFGLLASVLAALGLYGALSYAVHSRRREMGIRLAIGARPASVRREVLATGLRHALVGIAIGSLGAWAASAYGVSAVPGLQTLDSAALATIVLAILVVAAGRVLAARLPRKPRRSADDAPRGVGLTV